MDNDIKSTENKNSEFDPENKLDDYQSLIERFNSIKKALASLEKLFFKKI